MFTIALSFGQVPDFGAASSFALFTSAGAFNNAGTTVVTGDIGTNVGAFSGFPPGIVIGAIHVADPVTAQAAPDVDLAYMYLSGLTCGQVIGTTLGNNQILAPDIYCLGAASVLNGDLILDAGGDPDAIFIFQINGALSTNILSHIILAGSASSCNIYWQVNGAVALGDFSTFRGQIVANGAISLLQNAFLDGRAVTRAGAISLANNIVTLGASPIPPVITVTGALTFCQGGSVILSGNNNGGTWSTGETTPSITVTTSGDYYLTNTNGCGSSVSIHVIITVIPLPTINMLPDITVNDCTLIPAIQLTGNPPGVILNWIRTPEPIGANLNGVQVIPAFIATNTGSTPLTSTVIVTPSITINGVTCLGVPDTFKITVIDNVAPVFINCPSNISLTCGSTIPPPVTPTATDNCDNSVAITLIQTSTQTTTGTCSDNSYIITRTWTAMDNFGNIAVCVQSISVLDITAPIIITCPGPASISCSSLVPAPNPLLVTAIDNCSGPVSVIFLSDVITNQTCANRYTLTRTYRASDLCGNSSLCLQVFTVNDISLPIITCPANINLSCSDPIPAPNILLVSATDNCGGNPVISFISDVNVNMICPGVYTILRTYRATDLCGNFSNCVQSIFITNNVAPLINCPANLFLSCANQVPLPDVNSVTATGSCGGSVIISFVGDIISNQTCINRFLVTRTYRAIDLCGNIAFCNQLITVNDIIAPVMEPIDSIIFIQCDAVIPPPANMVVVGNCGGLPSISFLETSTQSPWLQLCEHFNYDITRIWIATDICGNSSSAIQILRIRDTTPPVLSMIPDTAVYVNCDEGAVHGCPMAMDLCDMTPSILFDFHYAKINGACASSYKVVRTWTAGDKCGNVSIATQNVYVIDNQAPELTCPGNIIKISTVPVIVNWMMPKAWDDCDGSLIAVQTKGPLNGSLFNPGTITVIEFETTDFCGNISTCSFTITIKSGSILVPGNKISGNIKNMQGGDIDNAEVTITGNVNQFMLTGLNYEFTGIVTGSSEVVSVAKNDFPLDGVNTLDLIKITNHILGKTLLNSPYKILAADVNNSGKITTGDLVELRKLILHISDKFTNAESWSFVPSTTTFKNPKNPWSDPINYKINIDNIQTDQLANFDGIKTGDVTWDAKGNGSGKITLKSNNFYSLLVKNQTFLSGEEIEVPIIAKDLKGIKGMQFTISYDPAVLEFLNIKSEQVDISEKNFGITHLESGSITASLDLSENIEGDNLFAISFKSLSPGSIRQVLNINSSLTPAEAYTQYDETIGVNLDFNFGAKPDNSISAELFQNEPNPFDNSTQIRFYIPDDQETSLSIFSLDGLLVKEYKQIYSKGEHSVNLTNDDFPAAGTYYYQLKSKYNTVTKKMIYLW